MERVLFFICTIFALVLTFHITTGEKLSLRQGPEEQDTAPEGADVMKKLKNCTMCPRLYKPVCASNGKWYHNPCFMACEVGDNSFINILYEGVCRPEHFKANPINGTTVIFPNCGICDTSENAYQPICGADGKTYYNACVMKCKASGIKTAHVGQCDHSSPNFSMEDHFVVNCTQCMKVYDPVCATNGEWYYNPCVMNCTLGHGSNVKIRYQGKCVHFWRKSDDTSKRS